MSRREVGRVVALWRYPVKSMAAQELSAVHVSWWGLVGDRRWAFIRPGQERKGWPWLTLRQLPDLCRYRPAFTDPDRPDSSVTLVRTPSGHVYDVADPVLAAELGPDVRVIKQSRGVFDIMPVSLLTTGSVAALGDGTLAPGRFRPNVLVEGSCEDSWVGRTLRIGDVRVRIDTRTRRCAVVNVDPVTTERDREVLRAVVRERNLWLGVYGSTVAYGTVAVGDPVVLEPM